MILIEIGSTNGGQGWPHHQISPELVTEPNDGQNTEKIFKKSEIFPKKVYEASNRHCSSYSVVLLVFSTN